MFSSKDTAGCSCKKVSTYSQASQMMVSLPPTRQLLLMSGSLPPIMALGSAPASIKIWVSMDVVVVLPWVPETATSRGYLAVSIPSITERSRVGTPFSLAAASSGLSALHAAVYTTACASPIFSPLWPINTGIPQPLTRSRVSDSLISDPLIS